MSRAGWRGGLIGISMVLTTPMLMALGPAPRSLAPGSHAVIPSGGTVAPATSASPPRSQRIKILSAALDRMTKNYKKLKFFEFSPGPEDILDYQLGALWRKGIDGTGTTIAVIEGWNDPSIGKFIASQDKIFHLPNPQITTIYPTGKHRLPAKCPPGMVKLKSYGSCSAWAGELELDVLSVHLMAPYAKILITVAPADSEITDDAASQVAPPEMMQAVEYLSSHHLASVISISDDTGESTYSHGPREIYAQDAGELTAAANGVPLLVGTGDCDAVQHLAVGPGNCDQDLTTKGRATAAWDDSPWVTAVGGTTPNLSKTGRRLGDDPVWNLGPFGFPFGEGAGLSSVFSRPGFQNDVSSIVGSRRSVPDISLDASDGTSEATPLLAGVLALATQLNHGQNVGPLNNVLYGLLGPAGLKDGVADVVSGNNSLIRTGKVAVKGFAAAKGFDIASGWGTIRASTFVPALATAAAARIDHAARRTAAIALTRLEHRASLSKFKIATDGATELRASGFLPGHPVTLLIDGVRILTLRASALGKVSYRIRPAAIHLQPGQHVIELVSMLITVTDAFRVR
jgi:hypothetical protein